MFPFEMEPGEKLCPTCLATAQLCHSIKVGDSLVVSDHAELRPTFKITAPHR